jgi:hypothetical protein
MVDSGTIGTSPLDIETLVEACTVRGNPRLQLMVRGRES